MDLRVLKAIVPEDAGTKTADLYRRLEEMPDYLCTCGAQFETKELADQHLEDVDARSSVG